MTSPDSSGADEYARQLVDQLFAAERQVASAHAALERTTRFYKNPRHILHLENIETLRNARARVRELEKRMFPSFYPART